MCGVPSVVAAPSDSVFIVCPPRKRWWVTGVLAITVLAHLGGSFDNVFSDLAYTVSVSSLWTR